MLISIKLYCCCHLTYWSEEVVNAVAPLTVVAVETAEEIVAPGLKLKASPQHCLAVRSSSKQVLGVEAPLFASCYLLSEYKTCIRIVSPIIILSYLSEGEEQLAGAPLTGAAAEKGLLLLRLEQPQPADQDSLKLLLLMAVVVLLMQESFELCYLQRGVKKWYQHMIALHNMVLQNYLLMGLMRVGLAVFGELVGAGTVRVCKCSAQHQVAMEWSGAGAPLTALAAAAVEVGVAAAAAVAAELAVESVLMASWGIFERQEACQDETACWRHSQPLQDHQNSGKAVVVAVAVAAAVVTKQKVC